jgi:hypothetical protein
MRRTFTSVVVILTCAAAAACSPHAFAKNGNQNYKSSGLALKHVEAKREPVYLIATDGSECTVSKERFAKTKRGDSALCIWRTP